jgi:hypothetical protein
LLEPYRAYAVLGGGGGAGNAVDVLDVSANVNIPEPNALALLLSALMLLGVCARRPRRRA